MRFDLKKDSKRLLFVVIASIIMSFTIKTFVHTGGLFPGGVNGLTILLQQIFLQYFNISLPYTIINILLNSIPIYIGFRYIGKKFTLFSLLMILLTGLLTDTLPSFPITYDTLLIAIFGGILNGIAISLCLYVDATSGGTDFIAIYLSQKEGKDSFNLILGFNIVILLIAGLLFGWEKALYSIIFQYVSTQVLHYLYQNYQRETLFIITSKAEEVAKRIHELCHHGATIMNAEGSYEHINRKVVYSVVSSSDVKKIILAVKELDPKAFINSTKSSNLSGRFYMKPKD